MTNRKGDTIKQNVQPIKDIKTLKQVQSTLLNMTGKQGRRNYTIFQVGKATMLRVSDVLGLKMSDVFDNQGHVQDNAFIHDQKTGKANKLYLKPVAGDLLVYRQWLNENGIESEWLFPAARKHEEHIQEKGFYKVMAKVGDLLGLDYLGTHTMRKTGAYMVYEQTGYNIGLVMKLLNHSSEAMTLEYLGLDQEARESALDNIDFG